MSVLFMEFDLIVCVIHDILCRYLWLSRSVCVCNFYVLKIIIFRFPSLCHLWMFQLNNNFLNISRVDISRSAFKLCIYPNKIVYLVTTIKLAEIMQTSLTKSICIKNQCTLVYLHYQWLFSLEQSVIRVDRLHWMLGTLFVKDKTYKVLVF